MEKPVAPVNGQTAPLANVSVCHAALYKAVHRPKHLPGMVCFYGPSGWGKSTAAAHVANALQAYHVEAKSSWTKKALVQAILKEMGVEPARTIYDMSEQVAEQLALSGRPLIVDEMDHIVDKCAVEIIRDIYEGSGAAILLIGEEGLPNKLRRWERFHGRIMAFAPALPADFEDAQALREMYCSVAIDDDLLRQVHAASGGSVRRICVNLERIQEAARRDGVEAMTLETWGNRELFTGEAPRRRV